jgi:hemoglobin/transferrin/lactoferrin receptor protein
MSFLNKTAFIAMLFFPYLTNAQTKFETKDTISFLDEVIITANKFPEQKKYVAQQILTLSSKYIFKANAQNTADLLASTGNVFIQKSQLGGGSVTLRGFEANRNLLVIDGVRMNNLIYRGGHLQNIITTDQSSFDRIEVLFGPASTIYGSDALGGVIAMYTKKPELCLNQKKHFELNAFSRYGSVNKEITAHVDVNAGNQKLASFTSLSFSDFGDLKSGRNTNPLYKEGYAKRLYYVDRINNKDSLMKNSKPYLQLYSSYHQYDVVQKYLLKASANKEHGLNVQFSNSSDVPRYDRLTDPSSSGLKYASWYYGPQTRLLAAYDFNKKSSNGFFQQIHYGINYQHVEESRHTRKFNSTALQNRNEEVNVWGANLDMNRHHNQHDIRVGIDAQYNNLQSTANQLNINTGEISKLDTRYPDGKNNMLNLGAYFSHTWKKNNTVTFTDGIRAGFTSLHSTIADTSFFHLPYNDINQKNAVYSGNAAVILNFKNGWKNSFQISTGFRVPNIDDLSKIFESAPGAIIVPNEQLKPEKTITIETGISKYSSNKLNWENNIYYTKFFDAIVTGPFNYNGKDSINYDGSFSKVFANQNQRKAFIYGFSSNLKMNLTRNFDLIITANYTHGKILTDSVNSPLDHIPPFMMSLKTNYQYQKWGFGLNVNYNGWKRIANYYLNGEDNEQYATSSGMPAWMTANFRVSYKVNNMLNIQAGVDNIFDTQYRTFASGIDGAGRNIFISLKYHK